MAAAAAQRIRDQTGSAISFRQGWGMTELSPIGTMGRRDGAFGVDNFAHIGQVLPFTEAKLISPENGETVAVGEEGELCIRAVMVIFIIFRRKVGEENHNVCCVFFQILLNLHDLHPLHLVT